MSTAALELEYRSGYDRCLCSLVYIDRTGFNRIKSKAPKM